MCKSTDEVLNSHDDSIKELYELVQSLEDKVAKLSASSNTTNGKINPCSNKECEYHKPDHDEGYCCTIYDVSEIEACNNYSA